MTLFKPNRKNTNLTTTKTEKNRMKGVKALLGLILTGCLLVSQQVSAATYYFHTDHLGTPQALTNNNQTVVWKGDYDPFGKATETVAMVEQNLRFPGQYLDRESGLHYNYYRTYDPQTGRYTQSDPIGLAGGVNTFGYAYQNPNIYTDPTGEFVPAIVWWALRAAWAAYEIAGSAYDIYGTAATFADECSSTTEKVVAGAVLMGGLFLPGAGYSAGKNIPMSAGRMDKQRGAVGDLRKKPGSLGKDKGTDALRRENKKPRDAARMAGLNKDQRKTLHREISGQGLSFDDIVSIAKDIKNGKI